MRSALRSGVAALALACSDVVLAEVATDGTMGAKVRLAGRDVTIGADLGGIRGKNLFHSFGRFDIETGGSATFTGPAGLDRVISRVTGGQASSIDGTLRSTVPGADVYLINPSGILFGPNARLDVPASFHASTADELRFPGGGVFSASDPSRTVLSVAAPEAFGFLGARPASITLNQGKLEVGVGKSLSLVGGAIVVTGNGVAEEAGIVRAPGGELTLASLGGKGEVSLLGDATLFDPGNDPAFRRGAIELAAGALVSTKSDGGGKIRIRSDRLSLAGNVGVHADNEGPTSSRGGVIVRAGAIDIIDGSALTADAFDSGAAGDVVLQAQSLRIEGSGLDTLTGITSNAAEGSSGAAGEVTIVVDGKLAIIAGVIAGSTAAIGDAGRVSVRAGSMKIDRASETDLFITGINSDAQLGSTGAAGEVEVEVDENLVIRGGGAIGSGTFASGDAGRVTVRAGNLKINGSATPDEFTGIVSSAEPDSTGAAGELTVIVDGKLAVLGGGAITSSTFASGDAGRVSVRAGSLKIDGTATPDAGPGIFSNAEEGSAGAAGEIEVEVDKLLAIRGGGAIGGGTFASGDAGRVTIRAGTLKINGSSTPDVFTGIISSAELDSTGSAGELTVIVDGNLTILAGGEITSSTAGGGNAGSVSVSSEKMTIDGSIPTDFRPGILSDALEGSTGAADEVTVTVSGRLEVLARGLISSSTFARGDAGRVTVRAGNLTIEGSGTSAEPGIFSDARADSTGAAGEVTVTVDKGLLVRGGGVIGGGTFASGDAGRVSVQAGTLRVLARGVIDSSTFASGDAGSLTVEAGNLKIEGSGSRIGSNSEGGSGAAGEVKVTVDDQLQVLGGGEIGSSSTGTGRAGDVEIEAGELRAKSGSILSSSARDLGGRLTIRAGKQLTLVGSEVSTNGTLPAGEASVISLSATTVLLSDSLVTALTGDGQPLVGAGVVDITAKRTFISKDSEVLGSSAVNIAGVINNLLAPTRPAPPAPTDPSRLLRDCAEERLGGRGSFKAAGRGGLPASPEEFLAGRAAASTGRGAILTSADCAR